MESLNLVESINAALKEAMRRDPNVIVLGEDVGVDGGVFRATDGLFERFGPERVLDTPLSETVIAGLSVGLATQGLRPVAEIQFMGFVYSAIDQLINHAARIRTRTRGRLTCQMVLRVPYGGGIHAPEHHSESTESLFAHMPGLRVVVPSSATNAYGLLLNAIENPDPVVFLEPKRIYRLHKETPIAEAEVPLDRCFTLRTGADVTLVTWGAMVQETLQAGDELAMSGVEAEIIDAATLKPLDMDTIIASVERTGRLVIVHEAALTAGFGAEIAAQVAEHAIFSLEAPIVRVAGYDTVVPLSQLERYYFPRCADIVAAARQVLDSC